MWPLKKKKLKDNANKKYKILITTTTIFGVIGVGLGVAGIFLPLSNNTNSFYVSTDKHYLNYYQVGDNNEKIGGQNYATIVVHGITLLDYESGKLKFLSRDLPNGPGMAVGNDENFHTLVNFDNVSSTDGHLVWQVRYAYQVKKLNETTDVIVTPTFEYKSRKSSCNLCLLHDDNEFKTITDYEDSGNLWTFTVGADSYPYTNRKLTLTHGSTEISNIFNMLEPFINTTKPTEDFSDFENSDTVIKDYINNYCDVRDFVAFYLIHAMTSAIEFANAGFTLSIEFKSVHFQVGKGWQFDVVQTASRNDISSWTNAEIKTVDSKYATFETFKYRTLGSTANNVLDFDLDTDNLDYLDPDDGVTPITKGDGWGSMINYKFHSPNQNDYTDYAFDNIIGSFSDQSINISSGQCGIINDLLFSNVAFSD